MPWPPGPCDPVPPIGPCDPVPPVGPGDVPPTPSDPSIDTNNWSYTSNTTSGTTTPPTATNYTQLNTPEDYLGSFNKP